MTGALLLKGLADLTFGGAFLWYLVKFLVSLGVAYAKDTSWYRNDEKSK